MARTLADAVAVFQAIVGDDPGDPVTTADPVMAAFRPANKPSTVPDYAAGLVRDGLKGARIGVLRQAYERDTTDPEVVAVFRAALEDMKTAGATIVDPVAVPLDNVRRAEGAGSCGGFKYDVNRYLASHGDRIPVKSLEDIIKSRRYHPSVQRRLEQSQEAQENGPETAGCKAEAEYRGRVRAAVVEVLDAQKLDAFVYPTWSNPPRLIGDLNTPHGDNSQFFSPTTGFPSIQVPMGYTRGGLLPAGVTFFGRAWDETRLIKLAYSVRTAHETPPPATVDTAPPLVDCMIEIYRGPPVGWPAETRPRQRSGRPGSDLYIPLVTTDAPDPGRGHGAVVRCSNTAPCHSSSSPCWFHSWSCRQRELACRKTNSPSSRMSMRTARRRSRFSNRS